MTNHIEVLRGRLFRKKPVIIEAMLFDGTQATASAICRWANAGDQVAGHEEPTISYLTRDGDEVNAFDMVIWTLEGDMTASPGDWIIKGVKGEFYPCKPDIFAATYEEAALAAMGAQGEAQETEELLCVNCGQPTMHMGSVCYACSHPAPQQPEAQAGGEVDDETILELARKHWVRGEWNGSGADAYRALTYEKSSPMVPQITRDVPTIGLRDFVKACVSASLTTPPAKVPEGDDVVGHKTFSDGRGGFRHEPLTRAEADALIAHCRSEDERRKALMPDERSAIRMMMDAHTRLTDMGWRDPIYCPKDGSTFEVIEPGSTGIHKCIYMGEWPKGSWWALGDGDMCPSRPVLFRPLAAAPAPKEGV